MHNFQNIKYLDVQNTIIYDCLFQSINNKILNLHNKLQIIKKYELKDNSIYAELFDIVKNKQVVLKKIEIHLEQLFKISNEQTTILKALEVIDEFFPDSELISNNVLLYNPYREYIFPINFVELLLGNFSSELHYRNKNEIIFSNKSIKRYRMYFENNVKRTGINSINYFNFIKKILSIAQFGYSVNNKSVHLASTVKIQRNF